MNNISFFGIAGLFVIPMIIVLVPIFIGQYYGIYRSKKSSDLQRESVGTAVGAAFALLAFMLAFTFQIATDRYGARKELLLDEVTNIRTTYLRAGLLPEPIRTDSKNLLAEYVDIRADFANDVSSLNVLLSRSPVILDSLWSYTETLAEQDRSSEVYALFTQSVNDLVDNYNQRITMSLEYRIPSIILWILFIIAFISMFALGYQFGISGKGSFMVNLLLAIVFAVVMFLILALDRPETGVARLNQKPVLTLQKQMHDMQLKVKPD
jgi:ABC-type multidrug transport system fused ATPase/permease subunit